MIQKAKLLSALLLSASLISACSSTQVNNSLKNRSDVTNDFTPYVQIINEKALQYINPKAKISVLSTGYKWTEGPLWIDGDSSTTDSYLIFADIPNNKIMKYTPNKGVELYLDKSGATGLSEWDSIQGSNGMLLNNKGQLVLLQQGDRRVAIMDAPLSSPESKFLTLADKYQGKRLNSPNDAVYHSDGSLYFTDPPYGLTQRMNDPHKELDFQGLYRVTATGELQLLDDSVNYPNGIGLSKDEKTLFVAVSDEDFPRWLAFDVQKDGSITNKRVLIDATKNVNVDGDQGMPDGMALHSSGNIFATGPGGVWLITPEGDVLAKIYTGKFTANCTLSADESVLYLTAHDTLMSVQLK